MTRNPNPTQLLLNLAQSEPSDVSHLAYSDKFEDVCEQVAPGATTADKHRLWEQLLELNPSIPSPAVEPATPEPRAVELAKAFKPETEAAQLGRPKSVQRPRFLFDNDDDAVDQSDVLDLQPWSTPTVPTLSAEQAQRREKMLADIAGSVLASREQQIAYILQRFPETRDSDTALCIRYWRTYQADVIERWNPLELEVLFELDRLESIGRIRRFIQNELRLFRGVEDTHSARQAMQVEMYEYLAAHRNTLPEIRFYLDETGNEAHKAYTGIAGLCIINWKQFEKHHAALELWRRRQGWPETIHFCDLDEDKVPRAVALLRQLQSRRSGMLFLGYSIASRGRTHDDTYSLFIQLIVDSLNLLRASNCLPREPRVRVIKEADPGFDEIYLRKMTQRLADVVAQEFPAEITVLPVEAKPKGRTVLLECADLIAGGMQRRALMKGRNPKDKFAEAVVNVTGFEDASEPGVLFKYFGG